MDKLEISTEKADAAKLKYAKLHVLLVQAMSKEKELLDDARSLNRKLQVSSRGWSALPILLRAVGLKMSPSCTFTGG